MSVHDCFTNAQFVTGIAKCALKMGISLQIGTDFHAYADFIKTHRQNLPLGLPFDPAKQSIRQDNGFFITGWNLAGELVHTQAMRRIDLQENLAKYLKQNFHKFPPSDQSLDFEKSWYQPGPGALKICGTACYHGEAWLKPGKGTHRGTGISGALARFALANAALRWSPNYVFGFMSEKHAFRGLVEREGYMHSDPGALYWQLKNSPEILRGYMVWMGAEDIRHMVSIQPSSPRPKPA